MRKVQLGCGSNLLKNWENYDAEVDITKKLPFDNDSIDILFVEHCIEHIDFLEFKFFLTEAYRIIKSNGVVRLTTPCLDKLIKITDEEYIKWTNEKFSGKIPTFATMLNTMFRAHGHQFIYDMKTLDILLTDAQFKNIKFYEPGESSNQDLRGIEHHWKKIGHRFNNLESISVEAIKKSEKY